MLEQRRSTCCGFGRSTHQDWGAGQFSGDPGRNRPWRVGRDNPQRPRLARTRWLCGSAHALAGASPPPALSAITSITSGRAGSGHPTTSASPLSSPPSNTNFPICSEPPGSSWQRSPITRRLWFHRRSSGGGAGFAYRPAFLPGAHGGAGHRSGPGYPAPNAMERRDRSRGRGRT